MWRSVSTGEDLPVRTGVRQARFLSFPNSAGNPVAEETPEPLGPRKRDHSSDQTAGASSRSVSKTGDFMCPPSQYITTGRMPTFDLSGASGVIVSPSLAKAERPRNP